MPLIEGSLSCDINYNTPTRLTLEKWKGATVSCSPPQSLPRWPDDDELMTSDDATRRIWVRPSVFFSIDAVTCNCDKMDRNGVSLRQQERVPEAILQLLGSKNLDEALKKIERLHQYANVNVELNAEICKMESQNQTLRMRCQDAECRTQELTNEIADLSGILEEAEIQLHTSLLEVQKAHAREFESMRAELHWELERTKQIAAEEIMHYSKQLSLAQSGLSMAFHDLKSNTPDCRQPPAKNKCSSRILRLSELSISCEESIKLPAVDATILEDKEHSIAIHTAPVLNVMALVESDFIASDQLKTQHSNDSEIKNSKADESVERKCSEVNQLQIKVQSISDEYQRLSDENSQLRHQILEHAQVVDKRKRVAVKKCFEKAISRFQNMALSMALEKWQQETRQSVIMKNVVRQMSNMAVSKSFETWCKAVYETKHAKVNESVERKCSEVNQLQIKVQSISDEYQRLSDENSQLRHQILEHAQVVDKRKRVAVKKCFEKAISRFQNMALSMALEKWQQETRQSVIMKNVVRQMSNMAVSKSFETWCKAVYETKHAKVNESLEKKSAELDLQHAIIVQMSEELTQTKFLFQQLQETLRHSSDPVSRGLCQDITATDDASENDGIQRHCLSETGTLASNEIQEKMNSLTKQLQDLTSEIVIKDETIASLEARNSSQTSTIISMETNSLKHRQKEDALEKEVALGAAHSSMLFKELRDTRDKLNVSSAEKNQLQEQQSGFIKQLDGASGSIEALWIEREMDLEVHLIALKI